MSAAQRRDYLKGVGLVLLATLGWSLSGVFVRTIETADRWQINAYRGLFMALALLIFLVAIYRGQTWARFTVIPRRALIASAAFFMGGSTGYIVALTLTSTANVSVLSNTAPIFAALLGWLLARERPSPVTWGALALAAIGIFVMFSGQLTPGDMLGNLVSLAVAFFFAGQTVCLRHYRAYDMVPAICVGGIGVFLVLGLGRADLAIAWRDVGLIAAMAVLQLAIPLVLYARGARFVPAVQLTLIALLDAVLNPFVAWLGVGEVPARAAIVGGAIVLAGVAVAVIFGNRAAKPPQP